MKILVTGANGFVGSHLARHCRSAGHEVVEADVEGGGEILNVDITDSASVEKMFVAVRPDACAHLAASTFVPDGWESPHSILKVNVLGTVNIVQACRNAVQDCRMLFASTSLVYDALAFHGENGDDMDSMVNPYSISKLAADMTVCSFARNRGLKAVVARPITHIGPGQSSRFAISSFARQLKLIAKGACAPLIRVGNLESTRDFLDVRDIAEAYLLLLEKGRAGESYDIASGRQVSLGQALKLLFQISGVEPEVEVDPELFRPTDSSPQLDAAKLRGEMGWYPKIDFEKTIKDIYESIAI